jgi:pimeloyl-ACP methyl ester carboxylesterase
MKRILDPTTVADISLDLHGKDGSVINMGAMGQFMDYVNRFEYSASLAGGNVSRPKGKEVPMPTAFVNGTRLHYDVKGHGIPLVFLHPPLLTSANFRYQQVQLSDAYQVVTLDMRGHGKSTASPVSVTYSVLVEDLKQLLDHLSLEKVCLCGYSTGGGLALEAMLTYPEKFIGAVLVSATPEVRDLWLKVRLASAVQLASAAWTSRLLALAIAWGNADGIVTFRNLLRDSSTGTRENMEQYFRASLRYRGLSRVSAIPQPVLLLYGSRDKSFQKYAHMLEERLPQSELVFLPEAKHQIPTKNAGMMNRLLRQWMSDHF